MSSTLAATRVSAPVRRKKAPWRDPAGKFSWLKLATLILVLLPGLSVALALYSGELGPRPLTEALHRIGEWTIRLMLIALFVSPARYVFNWPRVMIVRRMVGVAAAGYACTHLVVYCFDQKWQIGKIASEIVLRFYLTIGFVALLGLVVLAATSFDQVVRRMGRSWKRLHRLVYPIATLGILHYFIQSKAEVSPAVFAAGIFVWLMLWRALPRKAQGALWVLPLLAIGAGLLTVGLEALWYAVATKVDVSRVLAANLDLTFGPRPAVATAMLGGIVCVAAVVRRLFGRKRARVVAVA